MEYCSSSFTQLISSIFADLAVVKGGEIRIASEPMRLVSVNLVLVYLFFWQAFLFLQLSSSFASDFPTSPLLLLSDCELLLSFLTLLPSHFTNSFWSYVLCSEVFEATLCLCTGARQGSIVRRGIGNLLGISSKSFNGSKAGFYGLLGHIQKKNLIVLKYLR